MTMLQQKSRTLQFVLLVLFGCNQSFVSTQSICTTETNTFTVKIDLFAGDVGAFQFEECGNELNPVLGLKVGESYTFVQSDVSNYYHPLAFGYGPDAHLQGNDGTFGHHRQLQKVTTPALESNVAHRDDHPCLQDNSCPAPVYQISPDAIDVHAYHARFTHPIVEWYGQNWTVNLKVDYDETLQQDLFYICHAHHHLRPNMVGRIKLLLDNEQPIVSQNKPASDYQLPPKASFDQSCGTFGLAEYALPHPSCPETFLCDSSSSSIPSDYLDCLNAMNCYMFTHMTQTAMPLEKVLFLKQMIPHHQNAVQMAKALLKQRAPCDWGTMDCEMEGLLRSIINSQNAQIQEMEQLLFNYGYEHVSSPDESCVVHILESQRIIPNV